MLLLRVTIELRKIFKKFHVWVFFRKYVWNLLNLEKDYAQYHVRCAHVLKSVGFLRRFFLQEHFFPNLEICRQKVDSFNRHHSYLEEYFFLFDISVHWTNSQKVMYYLNIDVFYLNHVKSPLQHNSSENLTLCLKDLKCTV